MTFCLAEKGLLAKLLSWNFCSFCAVFVFEINQIAAVDLPSYELDVEETVDGDEVGDADGEAAAEGVVVLGRHVGKLAVAARQEYEWMLGTKGW